MIDSRGGDGSGGEIFLEAPSLSVLGILAANGGGGGGAGGAGMTAPVKPTFSNRAGGGGGAVGRIWLRTRGTPAGTPGTVSPPAMLDTTL